jgi:putative ABC transport system permease protein
MTRHPAPPSWRARSRLFRPSADQDVDEEFDFHLEMRTREYIERGWQPQHARAEALRRFGDLGAASRTCHRLGREMERRMQRREYLDEVVSDARFGARQLVKHRLFSAIATLTLAIGIGGTAAVFSLVNAVVLTPLPVPSPERLVSVVEVWRDRPGNVSVGNLLAWGERTRVFSAIAGVRYSNFNLAESDSPERVLGARVTGDFFKVFGVAPAQGRVLDANDDRPGSEQVVVLSHRLWTRRFGADPAIVNRDVRLDGRPYRVIGVMPAAFDFTNDAEELWVPIALLPEDRTNFDRHYLQVVARIRPGMTLEEAQAPLVVVAQQLEKEQPRENGERSAALIPLLDAFVDGVRDRFYLLLAAVTLVLLIACGNVANLLLARGATRAEELAVRTALGAGRPRLIRQLLTENLVLAGVGAVLGLAFAHFAVRAFIELSPPGVPRLERARVDGVTVLVTAAIALASSLIFGPVPAWRTARPDAQEVLKAGRSHGMGVARDRIRQTLIVVEVALALLLLLGSGLLIRTALALQQVDPGFEPSGVLSARVSLPRDQYLERPTVVRTFEQFVDATQRLPGATSVAVVSQAPLGFGGNSNGLIPEGRRIEPASAIDARLRIVTPEFYKTMGVPLMRGRAFTPDDRSGAPKVMIVSRAFADRAWPDQDPVGKRVACCEPGPDGKSPDYKTVVGVAGDVRSRGPALDPYPEFYLPIDQVPAVAWEWVQRTMFVVVRTTGDPAALVHSLRNTLKQVDPGIPLFDVDTMQARLAGSMATARFNTFLLTTLGLMGLTLAAIGIYGVIAYSVAQRTEEIGIRLALGAEPGDVTRMMVGQALRPVVIGLVVGLAGSLGLGRLMAGQLFGVTARDPVTVGVVAAITIVVSMAASYLPARRAAALDPSRALQVR